MGWAPWRRGGGGGPPFQCVPASAPQATPDRTGPKTAPRPQLPCRWPQEHSMGASLCALDSVLKGWRVMESHE